MYVCSIIVKRIDTGKNTGEENKLSISCKLRLDCANLYPNRRLEGLKKMEESYIVFIQDVRNELCKSEQKTAFHNQGKLFA